MKCKNPHCTGKTFIAVTEENQRLVGVKCFNCNARYSIDEIKILDEIDRDGFWNSVKWKVGTLA